MLCHFLVFSCFFQCYNLPSYLWPKAKNDLLYQPQWRSKDFTRPGQYVGMAFQQMQIVVFYQIPSQLPPLKSRGKSLTTEVNEIKQ